MIFSSGSERGMRMTSGVAFFVGEGLFFVGLSLGIIGSTSEPRARQAGWILLCLGGLSLLVAGLIATYQKRKSLSRDLSKLPPLRPLSLGRSFDSLLQTSQTSTLLRGPQFRTELLLAISPLDLQVPPHSTLILQHFAGLGASVEVEHQNAELRNGEILRVSSLEDARSVQISALDTADDFEESPSQQRAPQILAHFIADDSAKSG
jgi:hypothetical protein